MGLQPSSQIDGEPIAVVRGALLARTSRWHDLRLDAVTRPRADLERPDPDLIDALVRHGRDARRWLRSHEAAAELGDRCLTWLRSRNQFIDLDPSTPTALYARALHEAADVDLTVDRDQLVASLAGILQRHRHRVGRVVVDALGPSPVEVVSAEYRPFTQWQVLVLGAPVGPLLDIGCGRSAGLVRVLRARGFDAHGLDRVAPQDVARRVDWLHAPIAESQWATIVSHLSFSLHFVHHHLRGSDIIGAYADLYVRLLRGLAPGGVFAYVPSLPFVERHLDSSWLVTHHPVPGTDWSASHVRRA